MLYKVFGRNIYSKNSKYKKKFLSFLCMKGVTKETYENNGIEVITDEFDQLLLNERHVQKQLGLKNLPVLINTYDKEYKKKTDLN